VAVKQTRAASRQAPARRTPQHPSLSVSVSGSASAFAACLLALDVNGRYKMQDSNQWYSLQRSNTDPHPYTIQDPASNTSTLTPSVHDTHALPAVYSVTSAARTTHGEGSCHSPDTITHHLYCSSSSHFSSILGRTHALCTATILRPECLSLPFS
jgi:hypothetical protein